MHHTDTGLSMAGEACGGGRSMWELSVLLIQFCCEPAYGHVGMWIPVGRVYKNRNDKDNKNYVSNSLKNYMPTIFQLHKKKRKKRKRRAKQWRLPIQTENEPTL